MRVASRRRNARSCVMKKSVGLARTRNSSSQRIAARSRWFVGSSSSRMSGSPTNARASSTRRFIPPESEVNSGAPGSFISSISSSMRTSACHSSSVPATRKPPRTTSCTVPARPAGTSCGRREITRLAGRVISPSCGVSSPVIRRIKVVLPAPLRPTRQMRSPSSIWRSAPSSSGAAE